MAPPRKKFDNCKAIETEKHGLIISKGITGGRSFFRRLLHGAGTGLIF